MWALLKNAHFVRMNYRRTLRKVCTSIFLVWKIGENTKIVRFQVKIKCISVDRQKMVTETLVQMVIFCCVCSQMRMDGVSKTRHDECGQGL